MPWPWALESPAPPLAQLPVLVSGSHSSWEISPCFAKVLCAAPLAGASQDPCAQAPAR